MSSNERPNLCKHLTQAARHRSPPRAYTLLEILVILLILGAMAAILIPQYGKALGESQTDRLKTDLRTMRTDIANYRARAMVEGRPPYPSFADLTTPGRVLRGQTPVNSFSKSFQIQEVGRAQAKIRSVINPSLFGWNYFAEISGEKPFAVLYANTDQPTFEPSPDGGSLTANQQ